MLVEERRNQILAQAYAQGFVRTSVLVQQFDVSDVTLRSDLQELERRGRLTRTRGGAMTVHQDFGKSTFDARLMRKQGRQTEDRPGRIRDAQQQPDRDLRRRNNRPGAGPPHPPRHRSDRSPPDSTSPNTSSAPTASMS